MTNAHEVIARQRKVDAIVRKLWQEMAPEDRTDPETLMVLRKCGQEARDDFAAAAGQKSPSDVTWKMVTKRISELMQAARWGEEVAS